MAALEPEIVNTTERVINRFGPLERGCYLEEEFQLKTLKWEGGYRYSMKNCLYSALLEKILHNCSCVPDFYNHVHNHDKPPCRYVFLPTSQSHYLNGFISKLHISSKIKGCDTVTYHSIKYWNLFVFCQYLYQSSYIHYLLSVA